MVVEEKERTIFVADSFSELVGQTRRRTVKIFGFYLFCFSLKDYVGY